ncbi:GHKL domain-containing protein [Terrilactibacillus sp. BCM23-1]|uniref:histidine kinase n=1 Tax=Terrilactibacillus tamarindi TaxID=2599694 RepID=A0A6N8CMA7_9BACI|nr:HAMP domain-containing sensor histidine kinase [Terrilactibacillus tamarindi]MTT31174.1 GHKL domain-containing protein [Terrilactibacillus tamarindi]
MDTKLKNRLLIGIWILLLVSGIYGLYTVVSHGTQYIRGNYFQTPNFQSELNEFETALAALELNHSSPLEVKKHITVSDQEIHDYRYQYGDLMEQVSNITEQYENKINEAKENKNKNAENYYKKERDKKIDDINKNFSSDDYVRNKIIKAKEEQIDKYYKNIKKYNQKNLEFGKKVFKYYLRDTETDKIYTNISSQDKDINQNDMLFNDKFSLSKQTEFNTANFINIPDEGVGFQTTSESESLQTPNVTIVNVLSKSAKTYEGQIFILNSAPKNHFIMDQYHNYNIKRVIIIICLVFGLAALIFSYYLNKKRNTYQRIVSTHLIKVYDRIPIDLRAMLCLLNLIFVTTFINDSTSWTNVDYTFYSLDIFWEQGLAILSMATLAIQLIFLMDIVKNKKRSLQWEKSVIYLIYFSISKTFQNLVGMQIFVFVLLTLVFCFGIVAAFSYYVWDSLIPILLAFLIVGLPTLILVLRYVGYLSQIIINARQIVRGELPQDLPVKGLTPLAKLAEDINTLKHGVKTSQKEQAKSERLKNELITNVSHDLRTPLTSVITYTELLKTPDLTHDERNSYVQIIDRKAKRLKVLIDDLFEVTKMTSGNIELVMEQVNLNELLEQALAEYDDIIQDSKLQFRVTKPDKPVHAIVDGQKIWRVFDNLIGNIVKYSLENTRVYIDLRVKENEAIITFKNVTKYELGGNMDELFERFKRGDASRHTEGSGLGLAISKSIIDLHHGQFDIELDGDLFKVTVKLDI